MGKEYLKRFTICILGLVLCALSNYFGAKAGAAGTSGWNTLALGISAMTGLTMGRSALIVSLVVITIDIIFKGKFGFGTLLNIFLIAYFTDVFIAGLTFIPDPPNVFVGTIYAFLCMIFMAFGMIVYMSPGLGAGPRDTLMVIVGNRFPKAPIGAARFATEIAVMIIGVLMGASFGIGTVLSITLQSSIFQLACRICHFEPRNIHNENIKDTIDRIRGAR
ncbi:MAG: hypothetical protein IJH91_02690 [Mogibacterium sp.]|nr:hypothetical protein [Mogibacterium sp.]